MKKKGITLSTEIYPNIFRITLPLIGEKPGPVNVYLFIGGNITLLDTGTSRTTRILKTALREIGIKFQDIDSIILTHGHMDHYGAANRIVNISGGKTKVAAHREDVINIEAGSDVSRKAVSDFLKLMGVPFLFRESMRLMSIVFLSMAQNCRVDQILQDGDIIRLGNYNGKVILTPGHTKGSICIFLEREKILFSGDHILGHITPNAFVMLENDSTLPFRLSQVEFYDSLARVEVLSPSVVYPAHGDRITDLKGIADGYRESFAERHNLVLKILESGEYSVYQIARRLFPEIGGYRLPLEIYLAVSEVYTHIQVLLKHNRVYSMLNGKVIMFGVI